LRKFNKNIRSTLDREQKEVTSGAISVSGLIFEQTNYFLQFCFVYDSSNYLSVTDNIQFIDNFWHILLVQVHDYDDDDFCLVLCSVCYIVHFMCILC